MNPTFFELVSGGCWSRPYGGSGAGMRQRDRSSAVGRFMWYESAIPTHQEPGGTFTSENGSRCASISSRCSRVTFWELV